MAQRKIKDMPAAAPSRLYKYQPFTARTLTSLKVRTIWFGRPSGFNDPFDCQVPWRLKTVTPEDCLRLFAKHPNPEWKRIQADTRSIDLSGHPTPALIEAVHRQGHEALTGFAEEFYKARGVTCFSESPKDTLLWSHYGGGHRGLCLEFDTASPLLQRIHRVSYMDEVPELDVVDLLLGAIQRAASSRPLPREGAASVLSGSPETPPPAWTCTIGVMSEVVESTVRS
jgi:hypothetical protein